ncbi:hypothetical protein SAMN02982929_02986 [Saccharopolyspora kobensis]|uniref:Outer membrane channel protein CpnT-like N-terminal domain-containing protein n=1 Tax=Saccharopolyspora kobensis TaxID=146035 RepID=A0A1H6C1D0_9PSEU|nr:hypothetical protein [Saccharopolyspora kobensis]SEG66176.1 hypothetical protein SAMN02982929_02986 [Saccharopolyspora kobensis]SFC22265.1 hypothetical protein SAMN05216506_101225 [Saccharopolyspora kobensis]
MTLGIDESSDNPLIEDSTDVRNNYLQDANPLENMGAPSQDSGTGFMTGVTAFEAGWAIAEGVDKGDWKIAVSGMVALGLDVAGAAIDPIAYVAGQLFSWMLEHIEPARAALHALSGNPDMVKGYAASWTNVEKQMTEVSTQYRSAAAGTAEAWRGKASEAYRKQAETLAGLCREAAGGAHAIAGLTTGMAEVVNGVRTAVRDLLSAIAGSLVSWAIELACTVGAAAPLVVAQATSKIAQVVRIAGQLMKALGNALKDAVTWLVVIRDLFDGLIRAANQLQSA